MEVKLSMEKRYSAMIKVTNMSDEMFNDALFYRKLADKEENFFKKRRYNRIAIILFCSSAEAWMNSIMQDNLEKKLSFTDDEQKILDFVKNYNARMPRYFNNIRNKLYNYIPLSIIGEKINWETDKRDSFEDYILLSNMRNNVVHYGTRSNKELDDRDYIDLIQQAPNIIELLFKEYDNMGSTIETPVWFKYREDCIIE